QPKSQHGVDPFAQCLPAHGATPLKAAATPTAKVVTTLLPCEETTPSGLPAPTKLDVNSSPQTELENVPGIGPSIAERIIEARPFKSADDLQRVKGIGGGKRYEEIRPFFN